MMPTSPANNTVKQVILKQCVHARMFKYVCHTTSSLPFPQMARGILAIGSMMAASIDKTATALGGALNNYANNAINRSAPMSEPLTLSKSYVSR